MKQTNVVKTLALIARQVSPFTVPWVTQESVLTQSPYRVLVSCILSLRTKDELTRRASNNLFTQASTPAQMINLTVSQIEKLIYPVGFYKNKAKTIADISEKIINKYNGIVPADLNELLSFKGVGRKTANLVLGLGFGYPAICVDTHVHRISNRLGWVSTHAPLDTELALQKVIPQSKWIELNTNLVSFGQHVCVPVSPFCSKCFVREYCKQNAVQRSR